MSNAPKPTPREVDVQITHTSRTGEARSGVVRVRALEETDDARVSRVRANLAGVPWAHLDPEAQVLFSMAARVIVATVTEAGLPAWLEPLSEALLKYPDVAIELGVFIGRHTEDYFRDVATARGVGAAKPSVEVRRVAA
jgi:hypothetical protein